VAERSGNSPDLLDRFRAAYGFPFDPFQIEACTALQDGSSVLVAAPTGAGKTVVGEFAAWLALQRGGKTFYTTPIKALSNQKYGDFLGIYGPSDVGLLTGDNSVNSNAPCVVMTTEVLRNMIYEDSPTLRGLHYVVLDEVHYLQDPYRGAVWEEILIHLPVDVQIVSLSATVSNAEEFGEWLQTLRGRTGVIIEEKRPVEIRHWYFAGDELLPMFVRYGGGDEVVLNPRGRQFDTARSRGAERPQRGGKRPRAKRKIPFRTDVVDRLNWEDMLPAIYFIFSRRGCDEAVRQCMRDNVRLTDEKERAEILQYAESRVADLSPNELDVLGYSDWIEGLARGVAAHHAGMIPPFKETVEDPGLGDQHARPHGGDREPHEVHRREARDDDPRSVHAALGPSGTPRHRRSRALLRSAAKIHPVRCHHPIGLDPDLSADLLVPALVQHGREHDPQLHPE
jgi:ATP-dependent RNA helicase HelY